MFDLYRHGAAVADVRLRSERPLHMTRLLRGKPVSEALPLLGVLFRICGVAQRYAGLMAWRQATSAEVPPRLQQAQRLLVNLEIVREHLWQMLVVWPALSGSDPERKADLTLLSRLMPEMERGLFERGQGFAPDALLAPDPVAVESLMAQLQLLIEDHVLAMPIQQWQGIDTPEQLLGWAERGDTPAAGLIGDVLERSWQSLGRPADDLHGRTIALPNLPREDVECMLTGETRDDFVARPTWRGQCRESNVYTRQVGQPLVSGVTEAYGNGVLARFVARLVELVSGFLSVKQHSRDLAAHGDDTVSMQTGKDTGRGMAMIEAARGSLMHWLTLERGVIADYAIVAPTEWNFHPQGVAVQGLKTLVADDGRELKQQATLWINAIDPCVGYELRVH